MQFGFAIKTAHGMGLLWQTCNRGVRVVVTSKSGATIGQAPLTNAQALQWARFGRRWLPGQI